jgi:hypothetical protein
VAGVLRETAVTTGDHIAIALNMPGAGILSEMPFASTSKAEDLWTTRLEQHNANRPRFH